MRSFTWLLIAIATSASMARPAIAYDTPVVVTVVPNNKVAIEAAGHPLITQSSPSSINNSIQGTEHSQCQDYGRASAATGASGVDVTKHDENWYTISLNSDAYAHGGHYRTCTSCVFNQCVGIYGNDTSGTASASPSAIVTIAFNPEFKHLSDYTIAVSSTGAAPAFALTDNSGAQLDVHGKDGSPALLRAEPGKIYYLSTSLPTAAANNGGCCEDHKSSVATVDVRLTKAPILLSAYDVGYIVGGNQTMGYKNVGVVLLDGKVHCSGTLIGKATVLTAAHCLHGFDAQKMSFVLGNNYQFPYQNGGPFPVDGVAYPDGSAGPFNFNPKTYEDDIGLIYLHSPVQIATAALYNQKPSWDDILSNHRSLLFVGFGFNKLGGDLVGVGVKREGSWQIETVSNRTIAFSVPGQNTCHGDSGGPAFIETGPALLLAAVTSTGDDDCTHGVDTRVDAYSTWLAGKIK